MRQSKKTNTSYTVIDKGYIQENETRRAELEPQYKLYVFFKEYTFKKYLYQLFLLVNKYHQDSRDLCSEILMAIIR